MITACISGVGHAVPPTVVTNEDLTRYMDTSDEWIRTRSGIQERRWVRQGKPLRCVDLAKAAAKNALSMAKQDPAQIEAIIYATISADNEFPGSGTILKQELGIPGYVPVIEVRNHCSGFLYSLLVARTYIESGAYKNVLIVAAEIQSTGLDVSTRGRDTAVLFGDGAGAAFLRAGDLQSPGRLVDIILESDGEHAGVLGVQAPSFARPLPICAADFSGERPAAYPHMDGKLVFKMASTKMPEIIRKILSKNGLNISDIDVLVPHQANQRIIDMVARDLGEQLKVVSNIAKYGNTTAASIPLALSEAVAAGTIQSGSRVCLAAFGAGFSWGAALITW